MNLEDIEQRCFRYLMQVSNPLTPFESLVAQLREDADCPDFSERELLEFLGKHELFRVIETPGDEAARQLVNSGIPAGLHVILRTRIPPPGVLTGMIQQQLGTMTDALEKALADARSAGDAELERRVLDALVRAGKLKETAKGAFRTVE